MEKFLFFPVFSRRKIGRENLEGDFFRLKSDWGDLGSVMTANDGVRLNSVLPCVQVGRLSANLFDVVGRSCKQY